MNLYRRAALVAAAVATTVVGTVCTAVPAGAVEVYGDQTSKEATIKLSEPDLYMALRGWVSSDGVCDTATKLVNQFRGDVGLPPTFTVAACVAEVTTCVEQLPDDLEYKQKAKLAVVVRSDLTLVCSTYTWL